jgi:AcrR family transcriptional regulator
MDDTRQRILTAAINVFSRKGYHETRVDEIVAASDTSKGAVYFHFPSKQEIFLGLVDEFANLLEHEILKAIDQQESGLEKVNAALYACMHTFGKYRKLAKIFLVQALGLGAVFEEKRQQINARFASIIQTYLQQAAENGDIPPLDTEIAAYAWMGAIYEVVIRWVYFGSPHPNRSLPELRQLLLRSISVSSESIEQFNLQNFS